MLDDAAARPAPSGGPGTCPWCSAPLPSADAAVCPGCGARLIGDEGVEIPGVTAVDRDLLASAAAPRRVRRSIGALLVGEDDEIPVPSEAEMPALAPPDGEVRREMLRLELEARLTALQSKVKAIEAEAAPAAAPEPPAAPPAEPPAAASPPAAPPPSEP